MSEQHSPQMSPQEIRTALAAARADVLGSLEKGKGLPLSEVQELRQTVDDAIRQYEELLLATPQERRAEIEHSLGRQVIDLRRVAAMVPQIAKGTAVKHSQDRQPDGSQPFIETRPPPQWALPKDTFGSRRREQTLRPGDEVEAWCGPCNGLRTHNIIAMVGTEPKQVLCQSCNGRHGYRTTPARTKSEGSGAPRQQVAGGVYKARKTPEQLQEERRQQELDRLRDELAQVQNVLPFDQRRRYKAGEVIEHPEYGRGKIETALKSSIVVRFPTGRRSLVLK